MIGNQAICVTAPPSCSRPSGRLCIVALTIFFASIPSVPAVANSCELGKMAEFPITMTNLRPLMTAKINDTDVQFLVDSGAFYSMISAASAAEFKLATRPAPFGFYITGIGGGTAHASIATVGVFTLAGVPLHNVEFLVGGSEAGEGSVGILGQNVLHIADVEYDLGQGVVRLMRPRNCSKALLAYWVNGTSTILKTKRRTRRQAPAPVRGHPAATWDMISCPPTYRACRLTDPGRWSLWWSLMATMQMILLPTKVKLDCQRSPCTMYCWTGLAGHPPQMPSKYAKCH